MKTQRRVEVEVHGNENETKEIFADERKRFPTVCSERDRKRGLQPNSLLEQKVEKKVKRNISNLSFYLPELLLLYLFIKKSIKFILFSVFI